ncbi:chromosome segregation protein SMC [soil metagenome]
MSQVVPSTLDCANDLNGARHLMTLIESVPPRLTRLEMQGFKSFANRTVFVFEAGITAVIGPNGSGKSNISDGVRWVLGETSHNLLRSKKTEDVIFAGGNGKAPAGLAEVAVTFDNSSGWLPIEFSEVTVARRAFRSGENQYLINGRRVRLKDVQHLTSSLGQSYTVVGQGLVDTALSQRAEERRGLFEHAADLTGLQMKVAEAERNLGDAEANAERITDILSEVEPRLRTLERAATQAREWQGVRDRLRDLEERYFKATLTSILADLNVAEQCASKEQAGVESLRNRVESLSAALRDARNERDQSVALLDHHRLSMTSVVDQIRRIRHEQDLARERLSALRKRLEDLSETQSGIDVQAASVQEELEKLTVEVATIVRELNATGRNRSELERQVERSRDAHAARKRQAAHLASAAQTLERELNDVHRAWAVLEQRQSTATIEQERSDDQRSERLVRIDKLEAELAQLDAEDTVIEQQLTHVSDSIANQVERLTAAASAERKAATTVANFGSQLNETRARFEALKRIHESGAGLFAGVKVVLEAGRTGILEGIHGTLVELIAVPKRYETAIEVALGSHLQDVVVAGWSDAEAAIELLKRGKAGRATFQPVDSVQQPRMPNLDERVASQYGVFGTAASLIEIDPAFERIVQSLLGRVVIAEDLDVARKILPDIPSGWSVVTLTGEAVLSGGSVSGGSSVRESGVLERERTYRDLPGRISMLQAELDSAETDRDTLAGVLAQLDEERREHDAARASLVSARRERSAQRARIETWLSDQREDHRRAEERAAQFKELGAAASVELEKSRRESVRLEAELRQARIAGEDIDQKVRMDLEHLEGLERQLAVESHRQAGLEERHRGENRRRQGLLAQERVLRDERSTRSERVSVIQGEVEAVDRQVDRLEAELSGLLADRTRIESEIDPVQSRVAAVSSDCQRHEASLEESRQALMEAERRKGAADLSVERHRGDLMTIRQRIVDDLDLDDPEQLLEIEFNDLDDASEAEREISRLKERLKRVGYIGEEAVQEFERESERHRFLREQLDDVEGASASLRELLDGLRSTMRRRFEETFERVSTEFSNAFTMLFVGGTARLVMVASENGSGAGVDIVAQPPGKRLQTLALLSGGERALTAAALLFAILKVNPTPFVLLDEVDAALDEANVVRFREQLQELAKETQAVIITHNRGTIEVADCLYGVSMRDDGVSTVLSLRMAEDKAAV